MKQGVTFVVVSHDRETVQRLCPKTMFLYKGQKIFEGETTKAFDEYLSGKYPGFVSHVQQNQISNIEKDVEIVKVELLDKQRNPNCYFKAGDEAYVVVEYKVNIDDFTPIIYSRIFSEGQFINYCDTSFVKTKKIYKKGDIGKAILHYKSLSLLEGDYIFYIGAARVVSAVIDEFKEGLPFHVGSTMREGRYRVYFPYEWEVLQ
jgi:ABC-type multidrug transport system ATPase subunit